MYGQQCYDCSYSFPFDWIKENWREGFYVTSMATNGMEWGVVMSQGAGFSDQVFFFAMLNYGCLSFWQATYRSHANHVRDVQVVQLDFLYPGEGIHNRWSSGFCITATAANWRQAAFILSKPNGKPGLPSQDTMRCPTFPRTDMKVVQYMRTYLFLFADDSSSSP